MLSLVVALIGAGGVLYGALRVAASAAKPSSTALTVRYRTNTPATTPVGKPWLEVINTSDQPVALPDVTLRYYFSADDGAAYAANCVQTVLRCSNVTESIVAMPSPVPTASRYLQVGFASTAGILAPGQSSQGIGLQLYRLDHRDLSQADDRSFDATLSHYGPSTRVTAYLRGVLIWGQEPGNRAPSAHTTSATRPAVTIPTGVLFDNFHYTGVADAALSADGWKARTDGGGPGILGTWSTDAISFPAEPDAQGGQALQLQVGTDGTRQGTEQAELTGTDNTFFNGTLAARIYFTDQPTNGRNGDHIVESFATISPTSTSPRYSELDNEYQPNGGWGAPGPKLDTTSWRSATQGDRATHALYRHLAGWHIVMITAVHGVVTYFIDGHPVFSSSGKTFPREPMGIHLSTWLVDLPFTGSRTWNMRVNWIYARAGTAMTIAAVKKTVNGLYANGINYINTTTQTHQ